MWVQRDLERTSTGPEDQAEQPRNLELEHFVLQLTKQGERRGKGAQWVCASSTWQYNDSHPDIEPNWMDKKVASYSLP
jgi:hypothetical protein